mgnify:CR=1 FL=1
MIIFIYSWKPVIKGDKIIMDQNEMQYETYKKDKEIKEATLEIKKNVEDIKDKVDEGNEKLKEYNDK